MRVSAGISSRRAGNIMVRWQEDVRKTKGNVSDVWRITCQ